MGTVYIDSVQTRIVNISDIVDSLSANESTFTIDLLGYTTSNRLGSLVEVYGFTNNLLAIGNARKEIVKIGVRPRTSLEIVGYSAFLNWYPITGRFSGSLRDVIEALIVAANMDAILIGTRFLTSDIARDTEISISFDYQFLGQAIQQCLALSGYPLTYRIPVSEKIVEINQNGYGNPAPIATLNLDDLYTNCGLGITRPIQYSKIPPIASKIIVYGRNGLRTIGNGSVNPLDILRYTSKGENQFNTLKTADQLIKVLVTQPTPGGGCTTTVVVTGSNFTQNNSIGLYDYVLPTVTADPVSLVYTADIVNIKASSNVSFYADSIIDTTEGNLTITFEGVEIYNQALTAGISFITNIISLSAYATQSGEIVATLTLIAQPTTTTSYRLYLEADCCAIDTIIGTGTPGNNGDGLDRLATDINFPYEIRKDSSTGFLYFADNQNYLIRKVDLDGIVTTIGGSGGTAVAPVNGVATSQDFNQTLSISLYNNCIYLNLIEWGQIGKIDLDTGLYTIIYDDFDPGVNSFARLTVDSLGNIYFSDNLRHVVYKIANETTTTIYAGTLDTSGYSGDSGAATSATLNNPLGLCCDSNDNLYIADAQNNVIRKVDFDTGIITTVAGNGALETFGIDPLDFILNIPSIVEIDSSNNIYVDYVGDFLKIDILANTIDRFAGISSSGGPSFQGDTGSPLTAKFNFPGGIEVVSSTEFYVSDYGNHRIRQGYCGDSPNV